MTKNHQIKLKITNLLQKMHITISDLFPEDVTCAKCLFSTEVISSTVNYLIASMIHFVCQLVGEIF